MELRWGDAHSRLIGYAADALEQSLPPGLRATIQERVYVQIDDVQREVVPDVLVAEPRLPSTESPGGTSAAIASPLIVRVRSAPITERYIEISTAADERVITAIEFLSPTNKRPGEGRDMYLAKQAEYRQGRVSLVEIDLVRTGRRTLSIPSSAIPESHQTPYVACVTRGWELSSYEIYAAALRQPLPTIGVPLRQGERDVALNLQDLVNRAYRTGRYFMSDYSRHLDPPLDRGDYEWAMALLRARGLLS